jgi:hypothetical protein
MDSRSTVLRKRVEECDKELAQLKTQILNSRGNSQTLAKQKAMAVMKRRKMYSNQLEMLLGQQFNVEQVAFNQASVQDTINTVSAMKQAYTVQKAQMKQIKIGDVDKLMDDLHEQYLDMEEVNEIMSRNYGVDDIDEGELEDELNALDVEMLEDNLGRESLEVPSYLPSAPARKAEEELQL